MNAQGTLACAPKQKEKKNQPNLTDLVILNEFIQSCNTCCLLLKARNFPQSQALISLEC